MGLGGTAKKLQKVMDAAEKLYAKMNEIIGELKNLQTEVQNTSEQVDGLEQEVAKQRALLEALAREQGIDVEVTLESVDLPGEDDQSAGEDGDSSEDGTEIDVTDEQKNDR